MIRLRATITGRVQGVHYRVYVQDVATTLGVTGSVRNCNDGSVEVLAEGAPDTLKDLVEHLHEGSLRAEVEGVAVEWGTADGRWSDFSVR